MITPLTIHAFQRIRCGVSLPVWRSDAWQSPPTARHLVIVTSGQLNLFGASA